MISELPRAETYNSGLALILEFRKILWVTSLVCAISTIIIGFMDYYQNYID